MKVKITEVRKILESILASKGLKKIEAKIVTDEYLEGELQGKLSHGLMAFPSLVTKLGKKRKTYKVIKKTHASLYIDAKENVGSYIGIIASDMAMDMAEKEGISVVFIKNMITWLRPGTIAKHISDKGYIGFVTNSSGSALVAPPGGYEPVIGTNAVGVGIPTEKDSIVTDMATSVRAWGEVRKAERTNSDLPEGAFYNKKGGIAVKAKDAYSALPMGSYKGFALGLFFEILTSTLLERNPSLYVKKGEYRTAIRGAFVLVIDPGFTTTLKRFKKANMKLKKDIKKTRKPKNVDEIIFPGEKSGKMREKNLKRGWINVENKLWGEIKELAD